MKDNVAPSITLGIPSYMLLPFVREDKSTFARGLQCKVTDVVDQAMDVLYRTYIELSEFQPNQAALDQLNSTSLCYGFEAFERH